MKKTLILCILSAVLAAGITCLILLNIIRGEMSRRGILKKDMTLLNLQGFWETRAKEKTLIDEKSNSWKVSPQNAASFTENFRTDTVFNIPLSWTFDADDIENILHQDPTRNIVKLKLYAGVTNENGADVMTLIALGFDDKDVLYESNMLTTNIYEFADPCPPKCKNSSELILPPGNCFYRQVVSYDNVPIERCNESYIFPAKLH